MDLLAYGLFEFLSNLLGMPGPRGKTPAAAYRTAWRAVDGQPSAENVAQLQKAMRAATVSGSYAERPGSDAEFLTSCWMEGSDPRSTTKRLRRRTTGRGL